VSFTSTYYRGHDLLTPMPNDSAGDRDESWSMNTDGVDGGIGQVAVARAVDALTTARPHTFTLTTRADISDFLWWCALRRGAYAPFWVPTWRRDFQLVAGAGASDTELTVYDTDYASIGFTSEARRHLGVIVAANGARTVYPRRITASVDNGDGTETLTLESSLGVTLDTHAVLSFLVLARLESDDIPLQWSHLGLAEASVRFVELPVEVEG
jgi:hypothetical protein